MLLPTVKGLSV